MVGMARITHLGMISRRLFSAGLLNTARELEQSGSNGYNVFGKPQFRADLSERSQIKARVEADLGVRDNLVELHGAFHTSWPAEAPRRAELLGSNDLLGTRDDLMASLVLQLPLSSRGPPPLSL